MHVWILMCVSNAGFFVSAREELIVKIVLSWLIAFVFFLCVFSCVFVATKDGSLVTYLLLA